MSGFCGKGDQYDRLPAAIDVATPRSEGGLHWADCAERQRPCAVPLNVRNPERRAAGTAAPAAATTSTSCGERSSYLLSLPFRRDDRDFGAFENHFSELV
jgi:hypothetical protein